MRHAGRDRSGITNTITNGARHRTDFRSFPTQVRPRSVSTAKRRALQPALVAVCLPIANTKRAASNNNHHRTPGSRHPALHRTKTAWLLLLHNKYTRQGRILSP